MERNNWSAHIPPDSAGGGPAVDSLLDSIEIARLCGSTGVSVVIFPLLRLFQFLNVSPFYFRASQFYLPVNSVQYATANYYCALSASWNSSK